MTGQVKCRSLNRRPGIFFREDGTVSASLLFLLMSPALFVSGQRHWGVATLLIAALLGACTAAQEIREVDQQEIRFNILSAQDVVLEMAQWLKHSSTALVLDDTSTTLAASSSSSPKSSSSSSFPPALLETLPSKALLVIRSGLVAMSKKYGEAWKRRRRKGPRVKLELLEGSNSSSSIDGDNMDLLCQQAAYIGLRSFPSEDDIVSLSLSLLALVAREERVQERHLFAADVYGLNVPLACLQSALMRAKQWSSTATTTTSTTTNRTTDEVNQHEATESLLNNKDQQFAELQRKGCLLLGSLSSNTDLANQVVQEGGMQVILDALSWYRYHADVANWALWALFSLCYENNLRKVAFVQLDGILLILEVMRNCGADVMEVARHGTAILFDLMRDDGDDDPQQQQHPDDNSPQIMIDVWKIRRMSVELGVHDILLECMKSHETEMDIVMMSQEILIGTGYHGEIPQFHPTR